MGRTSRTRLGAVLIVSGLVLLAIIGSQFYVQWHSDGLASPPVLTSPSLPVSTHTGETLQPKKRHKAAMPMVRPAPPTQLAIPSIGVNAYVDGIVAVDKTAANPHGFLQPSESTPQDLMRAYWWSEQQAPGSNVSKTTFIIGHTCHIAGCPAVFNRLQDVKIGALVSIATKNGVLTYRIFRTHPYSANDVQYSSDVYDYNEPDWLVLATCKLRSDGAAQTDRFVAWAKLVASTKK